MLHPAHNRGDVLEGCVLIHVHRLPSWRGFTEHEVRAVVQELFGEGGPGVARVRGVRVGMERLHRHVNRKLCREGCRAGARSVHRACDGARADHTGHREQRQGVVLGRLLASGELAQGSQRGRELMRSDLQPFKYTLGHRFGIAQHPQRVLRSALELLVGRLVTERASLARTGTAQVGVPVVVSPASLALPVATRARPWDRRVALGRAHVDFHALVEVEVALAHFSPTAETGMSR